MKAALCSLIILSQIAHAQSDGKRFIGCPSDFIESLSTRSTNPPTLPSCSRESIQLEVEDIAFEEGCLSMSGKANGAKDSLFIFKGDIHEVYGWVLFKEKNIAFEYTTDEHGAVYVEKVPAQKVFAVDNFELPRNFDAGKSRAYEYSVVNSGSLPPHVGKYPGSNVNKLQSLPGAKKVLYLDITRIMMGDTPIGQPKEYIWQTWQCVATAYSHYQVNVTTDKDIYAQSGVTNAGALRFFNSAGRSYSPVGAFGTKQYSTVFRNISGNSVSAYATGRTAVHESGHLMGVIDYGGTPGGTYFVGLSNFKWVPIMGNYWSANAWKDDALMQWSKGEYTSANVKSDFLKIANKYFPYREDDITDTTPLNIDGDGLVRAENNHGQISPNTDSDTFTFEIPAEGGHAELKVDRIEYAGMLDVDARIIDDSGKLLAQSNPIAKRYAELNVKLQAGRYSLVIKGGAEGTPKNGFSSYGSLGFYGIEGKIRKLE